MKIQFAIGSFDVSVCFFFHYIKRSTMNLATGYNCYRYFFFRCAFFLTHRSVSGVLCILMFSTLLWTWALFSRILWMHFKFVVVFIGVEKAPMKKGLTVD